MAQGALLAAEHLQQAGDAAVSRRLHAPVQEALVSAASQRPAEFCTEEVHLSMQAMTSFERQVSTVKRDWHC